MQQSYETKVIKRSPNKNKLGIVNYQFAIPIPIKIKEIMELEFGDVLKVSIEKLKRGDTNEKNA